MLTRTAKNFLRRKIPVKIMSNTISSQQDRNTTHDLKQNPPRTTVDPDDISKHEKLKHQWWNRNGIMKALHSLNKLRVPFIRDGLINTVPNLDQQRDTPLPLNGCKILEVGCGGGFLAEPLSRLGAQMVGLDASEQLITLARDHSAQFSLPNLEYVHGTIEDFCERHYEQFDGVVASEVIEHVNDKELFVESCVKTLKPGGSIFVTTLNKTNVSWFNGILMAENILRIVPPGTHQWEKFISPSDMSRLLDKYDCKTKMVHGMVYLFVNNEWYWVANTSVNYAIHALKRG